MRMITYRDPLNQNRYDYDIVVTVLKLCPSAV